MQLFACFSCFGVNYSIFNRVESTESFSGCVPARQGGKLQQLFAVLAPLENKRKRHLERVFLGRMGLWFTNAVL